jgi:hypothetical protein
MFTLWFQQQLQNSVENRRKIIKMQIQFCWVPDEELYLFWEASIGFSV